MSHDSWVTSEPPPEYVQVRWFVDALIGLGSIGWMTNYVGMVYVSYRDSSYAMALLPLMCNIAWEILYTVYYPRPNLAEQFIFLVTVSLNFGVIFSAIKFSPREWGNAPLVQRNLAAFFIVGIALAIWGHWAIAQELGPSMANLWTGVGLQVVLSVGAFCQLLARNSTRGASWLVWYVLKHLRRLERAVQEYMLMQRKNRASRFIGTTLFYVTLIPKYTLWYDEYWIIGRPMMVYCIAMFFIADIAYGVAFYHIKKEEHKKKKQKLK